MYRRCGRCEQDLPPDAFNRHRQGRQWWCRECFRAYFRERGSVHREQVERSLRARRAALRRMLMRHLRDNPCRDCGEADVRMLEFDHVEPREEYVSKLLQRRVGRDRLRAEIARCEVVCANCHRRRTATRAGWRRLEVAPGDRLHRKPFVNRNLHWLYEHLRATGCIDCGTSELVVLDLDHVGAKRGSVTAMARSGYSRRVLEEELSRCEVRCANCHRRRTVESRGWFRARGLSSDQAPP